MATNTAENKGYDVSLEMVAEEMTTATIGEVTPEMITKIVQDDPKRAVYAAVIGNVLLSCEARPACLSNTTLFRVKVHTL